MVASGPDIPYACCDCGEPATLTAWQTSLCGGCKEERERIDEIVNAQRGVAKRARQEAREAFLREEEEAAAMAYRTVCDCGQPADQTWNGLPVCGDCLNTMEGKETGRRYREGKRLREVSAGGLLRDGDRLRFKSPKEQVKEFCRLDQQTKSIAREAGGVDPFAAIPSQC
jgi:hypothetical protein